MILAQELNVLDSEIASLQALIEAKRQQQEVLTSAESLASEALSRLTQAVSRIGEVAPGAIASLKTAVLTLFADGDGGNDDGGGNKPTDPTPDTDPTPGADDDEPELIAFNGETGDYLLSDGSTSVEGESSVPCGVCGADLQDEANYPEFVTAALAGICRSCEAEAIKAENSPSATEDSENKNTSSEGETTVPYVELVKVSDAIAYQRKHDGEIVCCYFGFRTKAIAQSWLHFFEAITSSVELRQAKRLEDCKWEIKAKGVSIKQIERFKAECDFSKSYRSEIGSAKPPHVEVTLPSDKIQEGQRIRTLCGKELVVTTSLQHSDQTFFAREGNGQRHLLKLDDVAEFLEGTDESPAQAAGIEPPSGWGKPQIQQTTFGVGNLVEWNGAKFRVGKVGKEVLVCTFPSEPADTKPHTSIPLVDCTLVEEDFPEFCEGDVCEVLEGRYKGQVGEVASFNRYSELPVSLTLPGGHIKGFLLSQLKLVSKSKNSQSRQGLHSGQVLLGNRIVTTGEYAGLGRRNAINNARNGLQDKLAAMELVKAGLSQEEAIAAVTGSTTASDDYDF
ncbi:MAG: hypothetical protein AB1861_29305 [Cyanobacteriota bacterium]